MESFRDSVDVFHTKCCLAAFPFALLLLAPLATAQWTTQSPVPTYLDVRGVAAPTAERVFIATDDNSFDNGGALFESTNGGTTWVQRNIPLSLGSPFNGIFFLDSQRGWAYGNENYRTTDGGSTWDSLPLLGSTYFMEFYTPTFGLASGNFDHFVSHDAGNSWVSSPHGMFAFDFIDNLIGLGVADTALYRTIDGGASFALVHPGVAKAVKFLSNTVAVGIVDSIFIRSTDGGLTWTPGISSAGKSRLLVVSEGVLLAWGRSGTFPNFDHSVFRSTDGGLTWTDIGEVIPAGIFAFTVVDPQTVHASDLRGNMFRSTNAGLTWVQTFTSPGPQPGFLSSADPAFSDPQTGYFGYGAGFVIKTSNGGASWSQISSGAGQSLSDIDRFSNGNLIAVGEEGTILTSTGMSPWILHPALSHSGIKAMHIINSSEVAVVDEEGRIFTSTDAGATWVAADTTPAGLSSAEDLHFTTLLDGWITGSGDLGRSLFHTTNGGGSWTPVAGFGGAYVSVDVEGQNLWAANVSGRYYRSIDSGATWVQGNLPGSPLQIRDMDFIDGSIGYAVGWWGFAARSDDGGLTWTVLPTPNASDNFTDIYLIGPNEFWLSTTNNVAYYTATGGQNWARLEIRSEGFGRFTGIAASPDGDAWLVGDQGYIEHFSGPPPPPLNRPPEAAFNFVTSGLTVYFTDTSSDPDGSIIAWAWDFGDGTNSTLQHPSHTFTQANTYIVRLTVTDDDSATGGRTRFIVVQPGPGGTFGNFTEVTPLDSLFVTPQDEDFWVITAAPADYDGDGDLDMAVLGYYVVYNQSVEDRLVLLRNDGPAGQGEWEFSYINVPLGTLTAGASDLAWGDVDGDGDQDLAVGTDGETVLFRNDVGILVQTNTVLPGYWEDNDQADFDLRSITWADFDNDGDVDLLVPSVFDFDTFSYRTALMRNDGSNGSGGWIFTEVDSVFAPTLHAQSAWADYDGDQDLDLLLVNIAPLTNDGFIRRYRNDGNGVFVGEDILGALTVEHGEVQWGDYDADGDLDILVAGHIKEISGTYTQALRIYRNTNGSYDSLEVIPCIPCDGWLELTAATWADYDSDGDMDILLAGTYNSGSQIDGRATIYINRGGVFSDSGSVLPAPRASGSRGGTFSWFDIDGEGDLDYFIAGQYFVPGGNGLVEAQMHVYRNDARAENRPPTSASGLNATREDSTTVILSWTPATDDHTPAAALTYDLHLFRNGVPVTTPRRAPEPGNVSAVHRWLLTGLREGRYDWTLRAVDAAYSGGPAVAGAFTIGNPTAVGPVDLLPRQFSLKSNYPNPFNPTTTIRYDLPIDAWVKLKIYSILGQEVATLVDGEEKAGQKSAQWNASNVPSGTYFYRLQAGPFSAVRKMLVVK